MKKLYIIKLLILITILITGCIDWDTFMANNCIMIYNSPDCPLHPQKDENGIPLLYVSERSGNDSYPGTKKKPLKSLHLATSIAYYNFEKVNIYIEKGTYEVTSNGDNYIEIYEGISLYGGFDDFDNDYPYPDPNVHETVIVDTSINSGSVLALFSKDNDTIKLTPDTVIDNLTIYAGDDDYSRAIYIDEGSPTISNCKIITKSNFSTGIYIYNNGSPVIINNQIYGSDNGKQSKGIIFDNSSPYIYNNIIMATEAINSYNSNPLIANNTIISPEVIVNSSREQGGIYNHNSSNSHIVNNIIYSYGDKYGIRFPSGVIIKNNNIVVTGTDIGTSFTGTDGNISLDPIFKSTDGLDGVIITGRDNDYHLTSGSPIEVKEGGLDLSNYNFFPTNSFEDPVDLDNKTRFVPWSIGAYE